MSYSSQDFQGLKDFKIVTHQWISAEEKCKLILVHGFGEHAKRYDLEAAQFNEAGYSVLAYDHRGHGKSDGTMSYVDSFQNYIEDLDTFINDSIHEGESFYIFGHSMGGLIVTKYLQTKVQHKGLKGVMLTGPLLMVSKDTAPLLQKVSGVVGSLLPKVKTVKLDASKISRIAEVVKDYNDDPLVYSGAIYARTASEMIKATKAAEKEFAKINQPILIMHGTEDKLTEPDGSQNLYDQCSSTDKEIILYEGGYHELTRDLVKDEVLGKMVDWMDARM